MTLMTFMPAVYTQQNTTWSVLVG